MEQISGLAEKKKLGLSRHSQDAARRQRRATRSRCERKDTGRPAED